jgi:hypothetical protein
LDSKGIQVGQRIWSGSIKVLCDNGIVEHGLRRVERYKVIREMTDRNDVRELSRVYTSQRVPASNNLDHFGLTEAHVGKLADEGLN